MKAPNCTYARPQGSFSLCTIDAYRRPSLGTCARCTQRNPIRDGPPSLPCCGNCFSVQHATAACPIPPDHSTEAESKRRSCCEPPK